MEKLNNKKRKKRKTRRCLDEIRKKTHQPNSVSKVNKNTDAMIPQNKSNCIKNNYLTSNRLTLFNKAVRSETVTRCKLSESESKKLKLNKDRESITSNTHTNIFPIEQITEDNSDKETFAPLNNGEKGRKVETPKSVILFSSESENEDAINNNSNRPLETSHKSNTTSSISTNTESKIFTDLMDRIEVYIKQNYPQLLNRNIKDKTKSKFNKLYSEYHNKDHKHINNSQIISQNVLSNSPYSSPDVPIIQNSRDYIGSSWTQLSSSPDVPIIQNSRDYIGSSLSQHSSSPDVPVIQNSRDYIGSSMSQDSSSPDVPVIQNSRDYIGSSMSQYSSSPDDPIIQNSRDYIGSSLSQLSSSDCPIIQNPKHYIGHSWTQLSEWKTSGIHESSPIERSSSSMSIHIPSTSTFVSAVYDTPEYSYYPHRLN